MLIHHLVPGQEEGNLALLEKIGGGRLACTPRELQQNVISLLADDGVRWRAMKDALMRHDRNAGALAAARFILDSSSPQRPETDPLSSSPSILHP
jgi:processive 1,2-diacylglycerol beta-glucosyltransferase